MISSCFNSYIYNLYTFRFQRCRCHMLISNCRRCLPSISTLLLIGSQPTIKAGSIQCKAPKSQASARRRSIAGTLQSFTHASIFCHTNDLVGCDFLCVHEILYRFLICIPTPREVENTLLEYLFPRYVIR